MDSVGSCQNGVIAVTVLIAFRLQSEFGLPRRSDTMSLWLSTVLIAFRLQSEFGRKRHSPQPLNWKTPWVLIAFRLQSEFGHGCALCEVAAAKGQVLIAFRLQSEFGPNSLSASMVVPSRSLNRHSASVRIWTKRHLGFHGRAFRVLIAFRLQSEFGPKLSPLSGVAWSSLNRLSASVRIWTGGGSSGHR